MTEGIDKEARERAKQLERRALESCCTDGRPQLVAEARRMILERYAKLMDDEEADFADLPRWERHATNAVLDLLKAEKRIAELEAAFAESCVEREAQENNLEPPKCCAGCFDATLDTCTNESCACHAGEKCFCLRYWNAHHPECPTVERESPQVPHPGSYISKEEVKELHERVERESKEPLIEWPIALNNHLHSHLPKKEAIRIWRIIEPAVRNWEELQAMAASPVDRAVGERTPNEVREWLELISKDWRKHIVRPDGWTESMLGIALPEILQIIDGGKR